MIQKQDRRLRVGVLGCGPIAQAAHFEACAKARNADLYAICDVAPDLLERMAATHEPRKTYADYDAMLADPELEAVIVATSDAFHVAGVDPGARGRQARALRKAARRRRSRRRNELRRRRRAHPAACSRSGT